MTAAREQRAPRAGEQRHRRVGLALAGGAVALALAFGCALAFGAADATLGDIWRALVTADASDRALLIREIRLPREVAAMCVGAALAVAGALMQGLTRNPLADPGLLGLTAGAAFGLSLAAAFLPGAGSFAIMASCFFGAAAGALLVLGIGSLKRGGLSPLRLVLAGAAVSALLHALAVAIGLSFHVSKDVSMWTAGGAAGTTWAHLSAALPLLGFGLLAALVLARPLAVLSLDESVAVGLGQNVRAVKLALLAAIVALAGASVALVGNLAFVGLMVPHIARFFVGADYRYVLPMSGLLGGALLLLADTLARTVNAPYETPLVAILAVVGLPFLLLIARGGGRSFT